MKNYWLNLKNKNVPQEIISKLPKKKQQQIATPFFSSRIVNATDPHRMGRLKIRLTPTIAKFFGKNKGTSLWAMPIASFAGNNIIIPPSGGLVGADAVLFKDKNGNLYYVGVKTPGHNILPTTNISPFSPGVCSLP